MRIENGKIIFEERTCLTCHGTMKCKPVRPCPNYNQVQRGKPCEHCGSSSKNGHRYLTMPEVPCNNDKCNNGKVPENRYDYAPREMWAGLQFIVVRSNRVQGIKENLLGIGAYSCTDYGRHKNMTNSELIEKIKSTGAMQVCKFTNKENEVLTMVIFTNENGYSVIGIAQVLAEKLKEEMIKKETV